MVINSLQTIISSRMPCRNLFVKLWKNRSGIRETGSVKNYLYKSFRRVLLRMMDMKHRKYEFSALIEDSEWSSRLESEQTIMSRERLERHQGQPGPRPGKDEPPATRDHPPPLLRGNGI